MLERPSRARVFERLGLDYCCGGKRSLADACRRRGLDADAVLASLDAEAAPASGEPDLRDAPLGEVCDHIVEVHHARLREELPRLSGLLAKVVRAHGADHPEFAVQRDVFEELRSELEEHLEEEENVLFPVCAELDAEGATGWPEGPRALRLRGRSRRGRCCARAALRADGRLRARGRPLQHAPRDPERARRALARPPPAHPRGEQHPLPARARDPAEAAGREASNLEPRPRHAGVRALLHVVEPDRAVREDVQAQPRAQLHPGAPPDRRSGHPRLAAADPDGRPHRPLRRPPDLLGAARRLGAARHPVRLRRQLLGPDRRRVPARHRRRVVRGRRPVRLGLVLARAAGLRARRLRDRKHRHRDRVLRRARNRRPLEPARARLGDWDRAARGCLAVLLVRPQRAPNGAADPLPRGAPLGLAALPARGLLLHHLRRLRGDGVSAADAAAGLVRLLEG